jgi:hypothetical protein
MGKTRQVILLQLEEYLQKVLDVQANFQLQVLPLAISAEV